MTTRFASCLLALLVVAGAGLARPVPMSAPAAPGDPQVRPGEWSRRKLPKGWTLLETEHFQVQSQCGEDKGRAVGEHLEAMLGVYRDMLPFRKRLPTFVVKVFRDRENFLEYYPRGQGAAAYYDQTNKELVGFDTGIIDGRRDTPARIRLNGSFAATLGDAQRQRLAALFEQITDAYTYDLADVFSHEGWHQYFHYYTVSWVSMPSWLDEGLGDYFFTARRVAEGDYELGLLNHNRLRRVRRAFDEGDTVTFGRMLEFEQRDYYENPGVFYAQGWSMVHFFMQHEDPEYRERIPDLLKHFKGSKNFVKSTEKVLGDLDLDELDEQWILWVVTQQPHDPIRELAVEFAGLIEPEHLEAPASWVDTYRWHIERLAEDAEHSR